MNNYETVMLAVLITFIRVHGAVGEFVFNNFIYAARDGVHVTTILNS